MSQERDRDLSMLELFLELLYEHASPRSGVLPENAVPLLRCEGVQLDTAKSLNVAMASASDSQALPRELVGIFPEAATAMTRKTTSDTKGRMCDPRLWGNTRPEALN
jgi:hypothetical protein